MQSRRSSAVLWLACAVLVLVQVAGGHLHLCRDGAQPPLHAHVGTDAGHLDDHAGHAPHGGAEDGQNPHGPAHGDVDVRVADTPLAKAGKALPDLPLWAVLCVLAFGLLAPPRSVPPRQRPAVWTDALHWRPPLRGPPSVFLN